MEGEKNLPGRFAKKICRGIIFKSCPVEFFLEKKLTDCALGLYCCISEYLLNIIYNSYWYCDWPCWCYRFSELDDFCDWCRFSRDMEIFSYEFDDLKSVLDNRNFFYGI